MKKKIVYYLGAFTSIFTVASVKIYFSLNQLLNPDEFEHLHAAWLVSLGQLPFRDFFEHHSPLIWYLLSPLTKIFENDPDIIFAGRIFFLLLNIPLSLTLFLIINKIYNSKIALISLILVNSMTVFFINTLEIRPDVLLILFLLLAILTFFERQNNPAAILGAGFFLSLAFFSKQTALLSIPAFVLQLTIDSQKNNKQRLKSIAWLLASFSLLPIIYFIYLINTHSLSEYLNLAFLFNLTLNTTFHFPFYADLGRGLPQDYIFWLIGLIGLLIAAKTAIKKRHPQYIFLFSIFLLFTLPLFFIPAPYWQYFLPSIIILAIFLGTVLKHIFYSTHHFKYFFPTFLITLFFVFSAGLSGIWRNFESNQKQIISLENILNKTGPDDKIFDGIGSAIFRPNAYYYWNFPQSLQEAYKSNQIPNNLSSSLIENKAKYLILNDRLLNLPEKEKIFIEENYSPSENQLLKQK